MCTRRFVLAVWCAATLAGLIAIPSIAEAWATRENFVTFSAPVALPGVTLAPGTYLFRSPSEMSSNVVQVLRQDKGKPMISYFMGMTQPVERTNPTRVASSHSARPCHGSERRSKRGSRTASASGTRSSTRARAPECLPSL